jgi:hypothetical protein
MIGGFRRPAPEARRRRTALGIGCSELRLIVVDPGVLARRGRTRVSPTTGDPSHVVVATRAANGSRLVAAFLTSARYCLSDQSPQMSSMETS